MWSCTNYTHSLICLHSLIKNIFLFFTVPVIIMKSGGSLHAPLPYTALDSQNVPKQLENYSTGRTFIFGPVVFVRLLLFIIISDPAPNTSFSKWVYPLDEVRVTKGMLCRLDMYLVSDWLVHRTCPGWVTLSRVPIGRFCRSFGWVPVTNYENNMSNLWGITILNCDISL